MISHPLPTHGVLNPYGLLIHSVGDGLAVKCLKSGDPVASTIETYAAMKEGPHYAIVPDGTIIRFANHLEVRYHAATSPADRASFLDGSWETSAKVPKGVVDWWKLRWPGVKSPQHLYPGKTPNQAYIGIELIPCGVYQGNSWEPVMGTPATPRGRFTGQQYGALAVLALMLHAQLGIDIFEPRRMLGHEDVNPITRPGWDPGSYHGWFSWSLFRGIFKGMKENS